MKKSCFTACALLIVLGGIAALPLGTQTITLTGSVRTTAGDPLAARITVLRGAPAAGIETHDTAAAGTFSITTSAAGVQAVSASAAIRLARGVSRRQRPIGRQRPSPLYRRSQAFAPG